MAVKELCTRTVVVARADESAGAVAELMRRFHVGDVIVVEERSGYRVPIGIVTDRDLVVEVMAEQVDPADITAGDLMSGELVTIREQQDVLEATARMRAKGVRRLVVVNESEGLEGVLTADDVIDVLAEEMNNLARLVVRQRRHEEARRSAP